MMFWTRVWNDGALRSLPLWVAVTALNTNVLVSAIIARAAGAGASEPPGRQLLLVLWLAVAIYLLFGKVRTRSHRLELALPICSRDLWLSHGLAVTLAGAVVLGASIGVVALNDQVLSNLRGGSGFDVDLLPLVGPLAAGLLLAVALLQSLRPGLWRLRGQRRSWALLLGGLAAIPALLLILRPWPVLATVACLLPALGIARRTVRSLPPVLSLVALEAAPAPSSAAVDRAAKAALPPAASATRTPVWRLLFSVLHNAPPMKQLLPWLLYFFIALVGYVLADGFRPFVDTEDIRFLYIPLGVYMLFAGAGVLGYHLHRLDPLPISRRLIFAVLTLPTLAVFLLGWAGGRLASATAGSPRPFVEYRIAGPYQWVEIEPAFMGMAWDGEAPRLSAPWGEAHEAWHRPLFKGSRAILYSPYNTHEETSARFEALLTSRAIEDIYRVSIPPEAIMDRYFVVEGDRLIDLASGGFTLLADFPQLRAPSTGPETPVYLLLILVPWLLLLWLFVRTFRAGASQRRPRVVYWVALAILLGLIVAQIATALAGWYSPDAARGFFDISVRRLGALPAGTLGTWAVSVALIVASYRLALSRFERAELPTSPIRCTLVDWGRSDDELS